MLEAFSLMGTVDELDESGKYLLSAKQDIYPLLFLFDGGEVIRKRDTNVKNQLLQCTMVSAR
jgi:hypothetical protein